MSSEGFTTSAVARRARLSPRQVQRLFRTQGQTFSDYLRAQRLERAQHMLTRARYAHLSVSAVAYEAGFGDLSHFNHAFRRRFGATPTEARMEAALRRRGRGASEPTAGASVDERLAGAGAKISG